MVKFKKLTFYQFFACDFTINRTVKNLFKKSILMDISFIGVSGNSIKGLFQKTDTIKTACNFLSSSLNVPSALIRIRSPNDSVFLSDVSKIGDLVSEKNIKTDSSFFIYMVLPAAPSHATNLIGQNSLIKANSYDYNEKIIPLPQSIFEIVKCLKSRPSSETTRIYKDYSRSFELPSDFLEKVESLHQMGFEIEESKEALRSSGFNVEAAVNRLINQNNRNANDEDVIRIRSTRLLDLLELISMVRNDDGNTDHDRIRRIIRLIAHRDNDDHDDDNNDDNNHNDQNENDHHDRLELAHFLLRQDSDNNSNSEDEDSIGNPQISDLMDELNEKLEDLEMGPIFDAFSKLVDESRDVIARSRDDQIIDFINFLINYIDQNGELPGFFERKINVLINYFDNEPNPDVDYLVRTLDKITRHDYDDEENESDDDEEEDSESDNDDFDID